MSELKPCPFCGENPISHNQLVACVYFSCSVNPSVKLENYEESKYAWNHRAETETETEKRLTADREGAVSIMGPSWQHAATKEPDIMTRYVKMAENQFNKKSEEIEHLTAIATKHATLNDERYELLLKQKSDIEKMLDQLFKHEKVDAWLVCKMNDMLDDVNHQLDKSRNEAEGD